ALAFINTGEEELLGAGRPHIEAVAMRQYGVAAPQRLDQRRVGPTDPVPMTIRSRMKAQRLHRRLIVNRTGKDHFVARCSRDGRMIAIARLDAAEHDELGSA